MDGGPPGPGQVRGLPVKTEPRALLVHYEDLPGLAAVLQDLGYHQMVVGVRGGVEDLRGETAYVKSGHMEVLIEPHWSVGFPPYSYGVDQDGLWQRAERAKLAGVETLVLCPEDCLLHLCLHLFNHRRDAWQISCCDIAELVHRYQASLDWAAFLDRVFQCRTGLPVRYSLQKAIGEFRCPIPSSVMERLQTYTPAGFEKRAFALLTDPGLSDARGAEALAKILTMPGVVSKLRFVGAVAFPAQEFLVMQYPDARPGLVGFYRILWLGKVFVEGLKAAVRLAFARG